ncbi:GLPGLI family protein [Rufibacter sp. LB8]|uniref:GLPGLI family protein n=1 Tax=Rufibacter sp. LB8 TaxID=2777781 RepID=UPI00178C3D52|nr:GLPGLI family protein [Rufibacter sp. LB8]
MRLLLTLLTIYFYSFLTNAQQYEIEYNHTITFDDLVTRAVYKLTATHEASYYIKLKSEQEARNGTELINANTGAIPFVYKDYLQKQTRYNQPMINKVFFIKDELPLQTWKLASETKQIKSFKCKKATTTFRGRKYTAWYSTDISLMGGPWKFDGLPGLILAVASDDGVLSIEATKIEKKPLKPLPVSTFKADEAITWDAYSLQYKKAMSRIKKSMQANAEPDVELTIKPNLVEIIPL